MTIFKPKTVAAVTKVFTKAINDLKQIEDEEMRKVRTIRENISRMDADALTSTANAENAAQVRAKLEALVS